jgi:hypothetical protein
MTMRAGLHRRSCSWALAPFVVVALAGLTPGAARAGEAALFVDSAEAAVTIAGRAVGPQPLANAAVEVRVGSRTFTATADAGGNFSVFANTLFDGGDPVEIVARGSGAQSGVAWRTTPGPIEDAQRRAGADGILSRDEDPFVDATPRSTAIAATLQLAGGGSLPRGAAAFQKAARALQWNYLGSLSAMLLLYGDGSVPLPSGVADTAAAVDGLARIQGTYAAWVVAERGVSCTSQPEPAVCRARRQVNTDGAITPADSVPQDDVLSAATGWSNVTRISNAVRFSSGTADVWRFDGNRVDDIPTAADTGAWTIRVGFPDQRALFSTDSFPFNPTVGAQVLQRREVYALHYRSTRGPGGQRLMAVGESFRNRYPNNPTLPDEIFPVSPAGGISTAIADGALPAALGPGPVVANQRLVLPVAKAPAAGVGWLLEYDVGQFAGGGVSFERSPVTASFSFVPDPWGLTLQVSDSPPVEQRISLVNEERPGVWRVRVSARVAGAGEEAILGDALLTAALPLSEGFSAGDVPASYDANINSDRCSGPLGRIEELVPVDASPFCFPRVGWALAPGGTGINIGNSDLPLTWSLPGGADTGRLRMDRLNLSGTSISNRRGWQIVRRGANELLVLENVNFSPPTPPPLPAFIRTTRLTIFTRLP